MAGTDPREASAPLSGTATAGGSSSAPRVPLRQHSGTRGRFLGAAFAVGCLAVISAVRILVLQPTVVTSAIM